MTKFKNPDFSKIHYFGSHFFIFKAQITFFTYQKLLPKYKFFIILILNIISKLKFLLEALLLAKVLIK